MKADSVGEGGFAGRCGCGGGIRSEPGGLSVRIRPGMTKIIRRRWCGCRGIGGKTFTLSFSKQKNTGRQKLWRDTGGGHPCPAKRNDLAGGQALSCQDQYGVG
jgi:hypothetical protein